MDLSLPDQCRDVFVASRLFVTTPRCRWDGLQVVPMNRHALKGVPTGATTMIRPRFVSPAVQSPTLE